MKALLIVLFNIIILANTIAQTVIRGKVTDVNGETLIGVTVYLKTNKIVGTFTDLDGNFSLSVKDDKPQVIAISYISYKTIEDTILLNRPLIIKNYVLEPAVTEIKDVVVSHKINRGSDNHLEAMKKMSSTTVDFISFETIKKTGDVNVASAIARVSGVSNTSGGLMTVRGAGDRYIKTTINGSRIPTLDPFTNNIKLDIFPSSLIDNITITKTARPDLPGDWAGAYISVDTKEYPDSLQISMETSFGYNQQTTFKDVVSSERSATDWLGYDNGLRDYDHSKYVQFINTYNKDIVGSFEYKEFVALGLGDYLKSIGITGSMDKTTKNLCYVELGLLGKAEINNDVATSAAEAKFNTYDYKGKAYEIINKEAIKSEKLFPNNWNAVNRKAPLNFSQSFSIGNQTKLFGRPLGYILGFRYSSSIQYDPNSRANKAINDGTIGINNLPHDSIFQKTSKETNGWSGLINVAYKLNANNNISLMFMPNVIGVNNVKDAKIYIQDGGVSSPQLQLKNTGNSIYQFYESRKQMIYQVKTEHYIPGPKLKIDFNASYTNGSSNAPDFKNATFQPLQAAQQNRPEFVGQNLGGAGRIYRYLNENIFDSRISAELPLGNNPELVRKIKLGGAYQNQYRERNQYFYQLNSGNGDYIGITPVMAAHPNADPYGLDRYDIDSVYHIVQQYYKYDNKPSDHIFGHSNIKAGYFMVDYAIIPALRVSGGLRIEQTYMYTDCNIFDKYNIPVNDSRRRFTGDGVMGQLFVNPGILNNTSYLPSANILIKLKRDESAPINLRLNFSQTIARPSLQELSDVGFYDYEIRNYVRGNSKLKPVQINNFDFRFEAYFKSGDDISLSLFYKDFKNHIELINYHPTVGFCFTNNTTKTSLKGIEIEGKKQITKFFEFRANITLVDSKSIPSQLSFNEGKIEKTFPSNRTVTMFGQAPYIINGMLTYNSKKNGVTASLNYNIQGPRLISISIAPLPDIYELPRHLVDFKVSKTLGKHFSVSVKINDVLASVKFWKFKNLNTDIVRAYKLDDKYPLDYDRFNYGTNYVFALSYKL